MTKDGEALGISGFTLSIVSLVLVVFSPIAGILCSIVGFIFCAIQQKRKPTKFGKAGTVISAISLLLNVVWVYFVYSYILPKLAALQSAAV